ncbi:hypothetical protein N7456_000922 [Penicillium angulare]|uniref:Uncharacterized protein n=1 Tax=Penicillium angulare TaxID=116970 RepID=A0A9W9GD20_9EURO|nr:hypothetical protein N7456_000922 [Penicillium angulare]
MDAYLSAETSLRYIPRSQRRFVDAVRNHSFRHRALGSGEQDIETHMRAISRSKQIFMSSYRRTTPKYLGVSALERKFMTAGNSVLENESRPAVPDVLEALDSNLRARLDQAKQPPFDRKLSVN